MRSRLLSLLFVSLGSSALALSGCSSESDGTTDPPEPTSTPATVPSTPEPATPPPSPTTPPTFAPPAPGADNPGPAPAGCAAPTKDAAGFFTRTTAQSSYVAFVPKSYTGKPTTLVVGMHGCGDSAYNFATWGVNPNKTRQAQSYIGISIGGQDGNCWSTTKDLDKVTAAIADISTCYYVHQQKVVLAGYSSGGILAYKLGLTQSAKFAGILIENSGLGGVAPSGASWKINVAHIAHNQDSNFPLASTQADWAKLEAAGIPLQKSAVPGTHDGTSDDWSDWLLPKIATWKAP